MKRPRPHFMRGVMLGGMAAATLSLAETATLPAAADPGWQQLAGRSVVRIEKKDRSLQATGILVGADGYFLTKASEVPKLDALSARLPDGTAAPAREVRRDTALDLVLCQCPGLTAAPAIKWGESQSIALGQWLLAPMHGGRDARLGVMSARRQKISGKGAAIGIRMEDVDAVKGVRIVEIIPESPAQLAGLMEDDVILEVDGEAVEKAAHVREIISSRSPGDELAIRCRRGTKETSRVLRLASRTRMETNWTGEDYGNGGVSIRTDHYPLVIQHDIPLGPADMGGPLLSLTGQAVGINIARVDRVTSYALPVESFWPAVQKWIEADRHPPKAQVK